MEIVTKKIYRELKPETGAQFFEEISKFYHKMIFFMKVSWTWQCFERNCRTLTYVTIFHRALGTSTTGSKTKCGTSTTLWKFRISFWNQWWKFLELYGKLLHTSKSSSFVQNTVRLSSLSWKNHFDDKN